MKLFVFLTEWLKSVYNPPYQLILEEKIKDESTNKFIYVFKQFGSHEFIRVTYEDISNCKNLMRTINQDDLKEIHISEYQYAIDKSRYKVTSFLRNNEYVISNNDRSERHSGEYISKNLDMFKNLDPSDIKTICYAEGFVKAMKMSNDIQNNNGIKTISKIMPLIEEMSHDNVVNLRDYK